MKLGIMQPYFLPYVGYWQLINHVDKYVIYDDVNFKKRGWINRNRILLNKKINYINVPMLGASQFKLINEIGVDNDVRLLNRNIRLIESAYKKAPQYNEVLPIIESIFRCGKENLAEYLIDSIHIICSYLDIGTEIVISSKLEKDNNKKAQEKILEICELLGATEYYNAIGGQELYDHNDFRNKGMKLKFLKSLNIAYRQFDCEFHGDLSILDVMMFNSKEKIKKFLNEFTIVVAD